MRALSLIPALLLFVALAPTTAAQDLVTPCEIHGHLSIPDLHAIRPPGVMRVRSIQDRDVRVRPLGRGMFEVHTSDDRPLVEGRAEHPIPFVLTTEHTFGGIAIVPAGTRVEELEPRGDAVRGMVVIHEGVSLQHVTMQCTDLSAIEPVDAALDTTTLRPGPVWHTRIQRLRLRQTPNDDAVPLTIVFDVDARSRVSWLERERVEGWARVEATMAHARLLGWARDTDLTLP